MDQTQRLPEAMTPTPTSAQPPAWLAAQWAALRGLDLPAVLWLLLLALPLGMGWTLWLAAQAMLRDLALWLCL